MFDSDKKKLREILEGEYAIHSKELTGAMAKAWLRHLEPYSIEAIEGAFDANARSSGRCPVPADVLRFLPDPLGHLGPEEAWNRVPKTEADAGYMTDQMAEGISAALDSIDRGDMVSGRMAFIEAYKRALASAQTQNIRARYWYSDSTVGDRTSRLRTKEQKTLEAAECKWITPQGALKSLENICSELGKSSTQYLTRLQSLTKDQLQLENGLPNTPPRLDRIGAGLRLISQGKKSQKEKINAGENPA